MTSRSNQSRSSGDLGGGDADLERVADVPVVGRLPLELDRHGGELAKERQRLGRETHALEPAQRDRLRRRAAALVEQAEPLQAGAGKDGAGEERTLGVEVAHARAARGRRERRPMNPLADPIRPLPGQLELVPGCVPGAQHQRRRRNLRGRERAVRRHHRRDPGQGRAELRGEALELARRDRQRLAGKHQLPQLWRRRPRQAHQAQAVGGALRADDPVPARAQEQHRLQGVSVPVLDPEQHADERPRAARTRDVEQDLAVPVPGQLAQLPARVDEWNPDPRGLVQQRPEPRPADAEVERLLGPVAVPVGRALLARAVERVQLTGERQVVGAVLAAAHLPGVKVAPAQRAIHPAAAHAGPHQTCQKARRAAAGGTARVQRQLDRERRPGSGRGRLVQQRAQRPLPRRRHRRRNEAQRPCGGTPVCGGDDQRRHVLAVVAHRAAALTLLEPQPTVTLGREEGDGLVQRPLAEHRARQRLGVRVPGELQHTTAASVGAAAIERPRPHRDLHPIQLHVAQLGARARHGRNLAIGPDAPIRAQLFPAPKRSKISSAATRRAITRSSRRRRASARLARVRWGSCVRGRPRPARPRGARGR